VRPGDRISVQLDKGIGALILYLATIRAGGVFLPLNTAYTPAEVEYFINDAKPVLLVCRPQSETALRPIADAAGAQLHTLTADGDAGTWTGLPAGQEDHHPVARADDDIAAILYTSGTTGRAKGAMLSHENLASNARTLADYWRFGPDDVLLHALPIFHTHGLFVAVNTVLVSGASMILLPRFDAAEIISLMPEATVLMGVPTFYNRLLNDSGLNADSAGHVRLFISGSAPLLAETHRAFETCTGHAILERYGMTETCMNTSNPYEGERRPGTVGLPLPGVEVRATDPESGVPLPRGEVGMLEVRGPNVFLGYWGMPEKTRAEFREDGFFITGDVGLIDDDGYVTIVGRNKDLIISGGFNVYPKEVEVEIDALPGVIESAVIGVPNPDFGEAVIAVVVPEPEAGLNEQLIIGRISERLARYKQPKKVLFIDALPRNAMGKVQKNLLRDEYSGLYEVGNRLNE
jgi:malonyl-CoA/methylmalonyl-CoA synthetase